MKKCCLDANLLVYFQDPQSPSNQEATAIIQKLTEESYEIIISSLVLDEYLYTSLKFSGKSRKEMKESLTKSLKRIFKLKNIILVNPGLELKKHLKVINLMVKYNLQPRDAYHLFIMLENKVKFLATFDSDFDKVFASGKIKKFT